MSYEDDYGAPHRRGRDRFEEYIPAPRGRVYRDDSMDERPRRPIYRENEHPRHRGGNYVEDELDRRSSYRERESYEGRRESYGGPSRRGSGRPRPQHERDMNQPSKILGVFGLSTRTTERDLYNIFSAYGSVRDIQMVYDSLTGRSRGFAFVYYESTDDARHAKANCDQGLEIDGKMARVDYSITNSAHLPTPGIYMGKFRRNEEVNDRRGERPYDRKRSDYIVSDSRRSDRDNYPARSFESRRGPQTSPRRSIYDGPPRRPLHRDQYRSRGGRYQGSIQRQRTMSSSRSRSPPPICRGGREGRSTDKAAVTGENKQQQTAVTSNGRSRSTHSFDSLSPENQPKLLEQTWPDDEEASN